MNPSRLHGLIDGVFAIALTLLVLDLPHPHDSTRLASDLAKQWPNYLAYLVSFTTVGILWIEHHGMMSAVRAIDRRFLERTLLFLLFISIIPWPTALAAEYADRGDQATAAAVVYAAVMLAMGLSFSLGWRYLARHLDLVAAPARAAVPAGARRSMFGSLTYVVAILLAFISPAASFAVDAVITVFFAVTRTDVPGLIHRSAQTGAE